MMPIFDQRGRFEIAEFIARARAFEAAEGDGECKLQVFGRIGVDFLECGEAVALEIAVMQEPVLRFLATLSARSWVMSAA